MKKIFVTITLCFLLVLSIGASQAKASNAVLLFVSREGSNNMELMLTSEIGVMMDMLKEAGYEVKVALPLGKPLVGNQTTLNPDLDLADVKVSDYVGFVMPCVSSAGSIFKESFEIVKQVVLDEKPLAAQQTSVDILAQSGVLKGRKYAHSQDLGIDGAIYSGMGVISDKKIVTSAICPFLSQIMGLRDGTTEFMKEFIDLLPSRLSVESKGKLATSWGAIKS